ncbi:hypothetical protein LTR95_005682 [Oleoguttula sp. CCFEE 5521]
MADSTDAQSSDALSTYEQERSRLAPLLPDMTSGAGSRNAHREESMYSPLISLAVKHAVDYYQYAGRGSTHSVTEQVQSSSLEGLPQIYPQYATRGCSIGQDDGGIGHGEPIMLNTNSPASTFICGSQGSGKSYTLACMMENCLLEDEQLGALVSPLVGLLFHYDVDSGNTIAEVASLCSRGIKVKVLVSRTNYHRLKAAYEGNAGEHSANLSVLPLPFQDHQLTNERMQRMMSMSETEGKTPLYMDVIMRILRDMALDPAPFSMAMFEALITLQTFDRVQENFLKQRMDLLKSFCASGARSYHTRALENARGQAARAVINSHPPIPEQNVLEIEPGTLTIIDLSDPSIGTSTACMLFDICLSIAKEKPITSGLVIALDEAHKYIDSCSAATTFTNSLLSTIREQRHKGVRVIIATQEPTISEKLLDLCSVTIVHRFTSPEWFQTLKRHLSGCSELTRSAEEQAALFKRIVGFGQGESLVFSPSSYVMLRVEGEVQVVGKLGDGVLRMKTRLRVGADGGRSVMAVKGAWKG